jgi:hypothetical protein
VTGREVLRLGWEGCGGKRLVRFVGVGYWGWGLGVVYSLNSLIVWVSLMLTLFSFIISIPSSITLVVVLLAPTMISLTSCNPLFL